ncbi:hypothetical protein ACFJIX_09825 [Roseateles sp. UC29_93]|uniref:hypothetical protein n=1 Tax=Roseateles sp. UC29_93 TaxID=3350177 RepID=UPI003670B624
MDPHTAPSQQARAALQAGDAVAAQAPGEEWLLLALEEGDDAQRAQALLHLARCDRVLHRPGDARERSELAARLFRAAGRRDRRGRRAVGARAQRVDGRASRGSDRGGAARPAPGAIAR